MPETLADLDLRPDPTLVHEAKWNSWPQPLKDGQTDARTNDVSPENPWRAIEQPLHQETPHPQGPRTRLNNVAETAFGGDRVGIRPMPLIGASPIEHSVYNPDIDPGHDELFDVVQGILENKAQGDDAKRKEEARIEKAYPEKRMAGEIRIYAEGVSSYMVGDILHRPNGTTVIMIAEVKSGDGKLSPNQASTLAKAVLTGKIYIVNEPAAKALEIEPRKTFADQRIIPQVYIVGGDQGAIKKQLGKLGA